VQDFFHQQQGPLATTGAKKTTKRMMFGKETVVKAKPAKTVVKAFLTHALKSVF